MKKLGRARSTELGKVSSERDPSHMLEILLALDRMIVETSMTIYNLPRQSRSAVRRQNQKLHDAVRQHLPRLLKQA